ncbi:FAD-dependent oxidoreductase [Bacteroidota bacterium]
MKIAVIGAGPAGMTAAYKLSKGLMDGKISRLDVYESSEQVGGMAKSISLWDQVVDLGPHRFFSHDKKVNSLWLEVAGKDYKMVNRQTRIYYKNKFFDYPLKAGNALKSLGLFEASRCMLSYFKQKVIPSRDTGTFESWVTRRFGKRLYQMFFKTYSEKLWGIKCTELDSDFAAQRIKRLSLYEAVKNSLFKNGKTKHKTLVDQFAFPTGGTGSLYEKMADSIRKNGGNILLRTAVEKVLNREAKAYALELESGKVIEYDHIISTMPISLLVTRLPEVPEEIKERALSLKFRNTILVYLKVAGSEVFTDQWLYIHSSELSMGRMTNFHNWIPELYGDQKDSILCLEYWSNFEDPEWKEDDSWYVELARKELALTGLAKKEDIMEGKVVRIPRSYPVYFSRYKEVLDPVQKYLDSVENLHVIGRYGAYKYNNQDHSIFMGLLAAENILNGTSHDLWEINTDYDTYQEASVINETGLAETS